MKTTLVWCSALGLLPCLLVLHLAGAAPGAGQQPAQPQVDPKVQAFLKPIALAEGDSELQKKLKERHNSGVALLEERINEFRRGSRDIMSIYQAARLVADAKLDLTATPQERIALLEQLLEMHQLMESRLQEQLNKGFGSKADLELARYARLSIEIDLLRSKQKATP